MMMGTGTGWTMIELLRRHKYQRGSIVGHVWCNEIDMVLFTRFSVRNRGEGDIMTKQGAGLGIQFMVSVRKEASLDISARCANQPQF
jgi:hypothetical protein